MDIVEFLNARYDEDEAVARHLDEHSSGHDRPYNPTDPTDPARVLADIAAKRAILAAHAPLLETVEWPDDQTGKGYALVCSSCGNRDIDDWVGWHPAPGEAGVFPDGVKPPYIVAPCNTLKLLAAPHAEHPDFDPAWSVG